MPLKNWKDNKHEEFPGACGQGWKADWILSVVMLKQIIPPVVQVNR